MGRRGDDGDEWLDEVADALADLGLFDADTREALLETVRDAVHEALPERPPVTVLPGGRSEGDAPTRGAPPELRVVEDPPADDDPVSVRVLRVGVPGDAQASLAEGRIAVGPGEDAWQTVRHGRTVTTYRLHCDHGALDVVADGELALHVEAGQSADVEGATLQVRASGPRAARGRYARL